MKKLKSIFCVLFGHAKVINVFMGYVSCARCSQQIGDTWGGTYPLEDRVIKGHDCEICHRNWKKLHLRDRIFTGGPK